LDLSFNHLIGTIPATIATLTKLVYLDLRDNLFTNNTCTILPSVSQCYLSPIYFNCSCSSIPISCNPSCIPTSFQK